MKLALTALAATLILSACGGQPMRLAGPGGDMSRYYQDKAQCDYEAASHTSPDDLSSQQSAVSSAVASSWREAELKDLCMRAKGYAMVPEN